MKICLNCKSRIENAISYNTKCPECGHMTFSRELTDMKLMNLQLVDDECANHAVEKGKTTAVCGSIVSEFQHREWNANRLSCDACYQILIDRGLLTLQIDAEMASKFDSINSRLQKHVGAINPKNDSNLAIADEELVKEIFSELSALANAKGITNQQIAGLYETYCKEKEIIPK